MGTPGEIIYEYLSTLDSTDHDVIQDTGCVKAGLSWHGIYFTFTVSLVNLIFYQRPHSQILSIDEFYVRIPECLLQKVFHSHMFSCLLKIRKIELSLLYLEDS